MTEKKLSFIKSISVAVKYLLKILRCKVGKKSTLG
jgi:hypothetical protein